MTDDKTLIHQGNLISLHKERVELANDKETYFDIVSHPGGAVIAAFNERNEVCILKQWRHAVGEEIWEFPAGCIDEGEKPLSGAKRELEEEAAILAGSWKSLGTIYATPGYSNEVLHLFSAHDLSQGTLNLDEAEELEAHWLPIEQVRTMAKSGTISDAKTLALLARL